MKLFKSAIFCKFRKKNIFFLLHLIKKKSYYVLVVGCFLFFFFFLSLLFLFLLLFYGYILFFFFGFGSFLSCSPPGTFCETLLTFSIWYCSVFICLIGAWFWSAHPSFFRWRAETATDDQKITQTICSRWAQGWQILGTPTKEQYRSQAFKGCTSSKGKSDSNACTISGKRSELYKFIKYPCSTRKYHYA